jgi:tetratricopeptide (TPR) repeat protein
VADGLLTGQLFVPQKPAHLGGETTEDASPAAGPPRQVANLPPRSGGSGAGLVVAGDNSELSGQSESQYFRSVARIGVQVAEALAYAHQQGIVHRDIKPANLLLDTHGTVWVTDFGLAKSIDAHELTGPGDIVGTLRYMAPERFLGVTDFRGDVYSLGVTLYELVTLQPPFDHADRLGLIKRVAQEEPLAPRKVRRPIPHDLETIILKALEKNPERRFPSAADLAEDLQRFLDDRPIQARPVGNLERAVKWARRRPAAAGALALTLLLVSGAVGAAFWYQQDRAERYAEEVRREEQILRRRAEAGHDIEQALGQARVARQNLLDQLGKPGGVFTLLNRPADWRGQLREAKLHLDKARASLARAEEGLSPELTQQLQVLEQQLTQGEADRQLAERLETIRQDRSTWVEGRFNDALAEREYPKAFAEAGLAVREEDAQLVSLSRRIRKSAIKEQLVAALDDWSDVAWRRYQKSLHARLLRVARLADPDPSRDQVRDPAAWTDPQCGKALAAKLLGNKIALDRLSPQVLGLVGHFLFFLKGDPEGWLRQAQAQHPNDFWLNFELANVLGKSRPGEAAGFFRAALAVRPQSTAAWTNLGNVLYFQNDLPGAVAANHKALKIDPQHAVAWFNIGRALHDQKNLKGAVAAYHKALDIDPQFAAAWNNLGVALGAQQDLAGAVDACHKALGIDPHLADAWINLGRVLHDQKDLPGAMDAYHKALDIDPQFAAAWFGLGNALRDQKNQPGAVDAYRRALKFDPHHAHAWTNLGNALRDQKQLPEAVTAYHKALKIDPQLALAWNNLGNVLGDQQDLPGAVAAYHKALKIDPEFALAWYNLGVALHHQQDLPGAAAAYQKALKLDPQVAEAHDALGMVLFDQGDFAQAQQATLRALQLFPASHPRRGTSQKQLQRCQNEIKFQQRALDLVQGKAPVGGPAELVQAAQFCRHFQRPYTAARLYAAAFAAQPGLADDLAEGYYGQAAGAAARAAAGQGHDADKLSASDKAKLRQQALDWLRADLRLLTKTVADFQAETKKASQPPASPLQKLIGQVRATDLADLLRVSDRLQDWLNNPALAGLRDPKALARLPAAEQWSWQQTWSDVQSLQAQIRVFFREIRWQGTLTRPQRELKHEVRLQAGKTYAFEFQGKQFQAQLRLEDSQGQKLAAAETTTAAPRQQSRLLFTAAQSGTHRIIITSVEPSGTGDYTLLMRTFADKKN